MSIIERILGIRPKSNDVASLRDAMTRADENLTTVHTRIAELERNRGALMLRGTAAEMKAGEDDLAAARLDADRLDSLRKMLEAEIPAAAQREFIAELKGKMQEAATLRAEFLRRWRKEYPVAAAQIATLLALEKRHDDARAEVVRFSESEARNRGLDLTAVSAALVGFPGTSAAAELSDTGTFVGASTGPWGFGQYVRLPGTEHTAEGSINERRFWPPAGTPI